MVDRHSREIVQRGDVHILIYRRFLLPPIRVIELLAVMVMFQQSSFSIRIVRYI